MDINANSLNIILLVGIIFYTFQSLSYTLDAYKVKYAHIENDAAILSGVKRSNGIETGKAHY
ncbi:MAG: D-alanyl-lipoteichoic acid acyltransferase DltB (MBOAT superfamily) [Patiriisocius sp.]|jgi:D-alanyl-lipoteichoic acid acyltransferase DltB (MBOAT superfamily)|tara:strand:- start:2758 stop:2943 length:186 start_codon:yes stop_codon:yes gene_type:complete